MPIVGAWCKVWICFGFVFGWSKAARPRFDTSTDMGLVLVPADAEVESVIFRLRATDQDADFPLVFEITATITPVVRIENLPCTLYNKVCQANVILTKRLIPGRLHDFAVRVKDTKGDSNSMQATISVTNATTPRDKIFPHIPSLIMVPEDTKPGKELDYLLVRANSWSGKPVYIELWQPKELFTIRQRQTPTQTRGIIILIGELDFETQSMYTLTMYATDPYTEPGKDTRNIAGLNVVVVVQDVQDVPPIFTLAPPLTRINNSVQPGDVILRVHAEDGDKGVPREIVYGLVSEGNPFTPFFNISETTGEIVLARPLEELTQITHVGAPVVLTVVAEEIRRSKEEPPAQATVVEVGFLLGEPGNSPPYFESDNYVTTIDENLEPGTVIVFGEQFSTRVRDEDIGKAGVFALKLENNNGTFEISPTVAERTADFVITVRDNTLIDYEQYKSLSFKIIAQEVGPATNLSASAPVTIFLRDVNDNPPVFDEKSYEVTLSENVTVGTRVIQVHATDKDTGSLGSVRYTGITGQGSEAFTMDPDTGLITVAMGSSLDREIAPRLLLSVEARDEDGKGNRGTVPLIVNLLDVNDNAPIFEKSVYEFMLNSDLTNFTTPAVIKAVDADAEPPNNVVRYELVHGNYENKFYLNEITGELILRSPITKVRRKKQSTQLAKKSGKEFVKGQADTQKAVPRTTARPATTTKSVQDEENEEDLVHEVQDGASIRRKRANDDALYTLTARAYDLGVPHLSSVAQIRILSGAGMEARIVMFVVPGEHPDLAKTTETLSTITGGRITVVETRPYVPQNQTGSGQPLPGGSKKSIIVARVEQIESGTALVDIEKIRQSLAANGVGIINGSETMTHDTRNDESTSPIAGDTIDNSHSTNVNSVNNTIIGVHNEEVTVYKAENKLLLWLLIILGLLMLLAIAALIICCICPGCPFYMAPRKRRVHSSETLIVRDGRPKRHLHRKPAAAVLETAWNGRKQAWSADPTRRNWQFNRRNTKNCGLASLPGDVAYISDQHNDVRVNVESLRVRDSAVYDPARGSIVGEQERMYVEDVEAQKMRGYDRPELDSLQRHELERGSDMPRQDYRQRHDSRYIEPEITGEATVREQHFYRDGNAEVLRLVTRGQAEDSTVSHHHRQHHQPTTLIVDGKEILLRRFIEEQKSKQDLSLQELELARSMESHQRAQDILKQQQQQQQSEVILVPDRLDLGHRQHEEEIGPTVQRLVIDHGEYGSPKLEGKQVPIKGTPRRLERHDNRPLEDSQLHDRVSIAKERMRSTNIQSFSFHDLELARQNALLTRLLLEREGRHAAGGVMDTASYLETQSLPGQVAIATQTDRTTATQTERQVRSRSDNDESDEDSKHRKKLKCKKRYGDGDWKRTRTLWMKSPIEEEDGPCFDKRLSILRKKVREVKEGRRTSLEPGVLREISDSLDGNGSSYPAEEEESTQTYQRSTEQTSIRYKVLNEEENGSPSSVDIEKDNYERIFGEKTREPVSEDGRVDVTESTSSPEIREPQEKPARRKSEGKSPRKEGKAKPQRKSDGVMKPNFRILEREITMLTKRLSKLGEKKFPESSDSTSQGKPERTKESRKDSEQGSYKKADTSAPRAQSTSKSPLTEQTGSQRKEAAIAKTRQKLKYQQAQVMSTGSSEYEDPFEKPRKQSSGQVSQDAKQKAAASQAKSKRQLQMERREPKKQSTSEQEPEKRKEAARPEQKPEKFGKSGVRAPKLAALPRKETALEEPSTSTSSDRTAGKKSARRDSGKKHSAESSGNGSNDAKRPVTEEQVSETFSDHFVKEPRRLRQPAAADRPEKLKRDGAADLGKFAEDRIEDQVAELSETEKRGMEEGTLFCRVEERQVESPAVSGAEQKRKAESAVSIGAEKYEKAPIVPESIPGKMEEFEVPVGDKSTCDELRNADVEGMEKIETEGKKEGTEGDAKGIEDDFKSAMEKSGSNGDQVGIAEKDLIILDRDIQESGRDKVEAFKEENIISRSALSAVQAKVDGTAKVRESKDMLLGDVDGERTSVTMDETGDAKVEREFSDVALDTKEGERADKLTRRELQSDAEKKEEAKEGEEGKEEEKSSERLGEVKQDSSEKSEEAHREQDTIEMTHTTTEFEERKEVTELPSHVAEGKDPDEKDSAISDFEKGVTSAKFESDEAKIGMNEQENLDIDQKSTGNVSEKGTGAEAAIQPAEEEKLLQDEVSTQGQDREEEMFIDLQIEKFPEEESQGNGQESKEASLGEQQLAMFTMEEYGERDKPLADLEKQTSKKDCTGDELKRHKEKEDVAQPEIVASENQTAKAAEQLETEKEVITDKSAESSVVDKEIIGVTRAEKGQEDLIQVETVVPNKEHREHDTVEAKREGPVDNAPGDLPDTLDKTKKFNEEEVELDTYKHKDDDAEDQRTKELSSIPIEAKGKETEEMLEHAEKEQSPDVTKNKDGDGPESIISSSGIGELTVDKNEQYRQEDQKETFVVKRNQNSASDVEMKELTKKGPEESIKDDELKIDASTKENGRTDIPMLPQAILEKPAELKIVEDESESSTTADEVKLSSDVEKSHEESSEVDTHLSEHPQISTMQAAESENGTSIIIVDAEEDNTGKELFKPVETKVTESATMKDDEQTNETLPLVAPDDDTKAEDGRQSEKETKDFHAMESKSIPVQEAVEKPEDIKKREEETDDKMTTSGKVDKEKSMLRKTEEKISEEGTKPEQLARPQDFVKYASLRMIESERAQVELSDDYLRREIGQPSAAQSEDPKVFHRSAAPSPELQTGGKLERSTTAEGTVEGKTSSESGMSSAEGSRIKSDDNIQGAESLETPEPRKSASTEKEEEEEEERKFELIMSPRPAEPVTVFEPDKQLEPEDKQIELQAAGQVIERRTFAGREDKSQPSAVGRLMKEPRSAGSFPDESSAAIGEKTDGKFDPRGTGRARDNEEGFADGHLPLYASIVDTPEDSDESDSSSDISRKTTVTTGPYQTPRHRARSFSDVELAELMAEEAAVKSLDSGEETLAMELVEDVNGESSEDKEKQEEPRSGDERDPGAELTDLKRRVDDDETSGKVGVEPSVLSELVEPEKTSSEGKLEETALGGPLKSTLGLASEFASSGDSKSAVDKKRERDESLHVKRETSPASKKQSGKGESSRTSGRRAKQPERPRFPHGKKGSSPDATSDERSTRARDKAQRRSEHQDTEQSNRRGSVQGKDRGKSEADRGRKSSLTKPKREKERKPSSSEKSSPPKTGEVDTSKARPKYMAWYKKKREEMERKRAELKEDDGQLPRWLQRSGKKSRREKAEKRKDEETPERTPGTKRKVKPLVNVESEQLKAIVRQGRKLRRAEGGGNEDPPVQIFATTPPAAPDPKHHLVQHSEYKYEKIPPPFYLHPPPVPHPSPQLSPQHFDSEESMEQRRLEEEFDSGVAIPMQPAGRLRHQQLLEKKSVFDIAYSEAAPPQLRSDSATPPS